MKIFVWQNNEEHGPFTRDEIFAHLRDGRFSEIDQARTEEEEGWRELKEVVKGRFSNLFSLEQIDAAQESRITPEVPIVDFGPKKRAANNAERDNNSLFKILLQHGVILAGAIAILVAVLLFNEESASPGVAIQGTGEQAINDQSVDAGVPSKSGDPIPPKRNDTISSGEKRSSNVAGSNGAGTDPGIGPVAPAAKGMVATNPKINEGGGEPELGGEMKPAPAPMGLLADTKPKVMALPNAAPPQAPASMPMPPTTPAPMPVTMHDSALNYTGEPTIAQISVETRCKRQPELKMFLRLPVNVPEGGIKGVLAFCTWAKDSKSILKNLKTPLNKDPRSLEGLASLVQDINRFAEKNGLAVLTWNTQQLWNSDENSAELEAYERDLMDKDFDKVALAWERGFNKLTRENQVPSQNVLLYGISRGGQWAHRLALRKPQYFLAVHVHIASSYDKPTASAKRVMWLVTTGERESGVARSQEFYAKCRAMGYPIIYKAVEGLGHSESVIAEELGKLFFGYALKLAEDEKRSQRPMGELLAAGSGSQYLKHLQSAMYIGDIAHQKVVPASEAGKIPGAYQVPLPTEAIANAWNQR